MEGRHKGERQTPNVSASRSPSDEPEARQGQRFDERCTNESGVWRDGSKMSARRLVEAARAEHMVIGCTPILCTPSTGGQGTWPRGTPRSGYHSKKRPTPLLHQPHLHAHPPPIIMQLTAMASKQRDLQSQSVRVCVCVCHCVESRVISSKEKHGPKKQMQIFSFLFSRAHLTRAV